MANQSLFQQTLLFGASVKNFVGGLNLNDQVGNVTVDLVEDPANGEKIYYSSYDNNFNLTVYNSAQSTTVSDKFNPPPVGSPVYFQFGQFQFGGILQSAVKTKGFDGDPIYRVVINDPRQLLGCVELILGSYNGITQPFVNLYNIYGFWEDPTNPLGGGFGLSLSNEAGIPAYKVVQAVTAISSNNLFSTKYGGPYISHQGYNFGIDLSQLPPIAPFYRVGPTNMNLLDFITQYCNDSGCDYYVTLTFTNNSFPFISVIPVSRVIQPQLGQIDKFVNSVVGTETNEIGTELRVEPTSAFLIGGPQENLFLTFGSSGTYAADPYHFFGNEVDVPILPYWGVDFFGNAIIGRGNFMSNDHNFDIDISDLPIPNFPPTYNVSVGELRAAMEGFDIWASYLAVKNKPLAQMLNIGNTFDPTNVLNALANGNNFTQLDLLNLTPPWQLYTNQKLRDDHPELYFANIFFNRIYKYADEYYGRKWLVQIPDISVKLEPDTGRIVYSDEPSDGGYLPNGSFPLGLPPQFEDLFQTEDGRFGAFAHFPINVNAPSSSTSGNVPGVWTQIDITEVSPDTTVFSNNDVYLQGNLEPTIVFEDLATLSGPRAVLTLDGRLWKMNTQIPPKVDALISFLQDANNQNQQVNQSNDFIVVNPNAAGGISTEITDTGRQIIQDSLANLQQGISPTLLTPFALIPDAAAIPLRSNRLTYGPWYSIGPQGKVHFEQNTALTPWNYGGINEMNLAGNAQIAALTTSLQIAERGHLTVPGPPTVLLGQPLTLGGPIVNGIDCQVGLDGVKTSYILQTYSQRFGYMAKSFGDTFTRIARNSQAYKRNFLTQNRRAAFLTAKYSQQKPAQGKPSKQVKTDTPHEAITGYIDPQSNKTAVSILTTIEGIGGLHLADTSPSGFQATSLASLDSVFTPFTFDSGNFALPRWQTPSGTVKIPNSLYLNPIMDSGGNLNTSIQLATFGTDNEDPPETYLTNSDLYEPKSTRLVGMRLPMVAAGWGYDINGKPVPNADTKAGLSNNFASDYAKNPRNWKVGPVDFRWDDSRKVWAAGGSSIDVYVIIAQSGAVDGSQDPVQASQKPRYVVRQVTKMDKLGNLTYDDPSQTPPMSGGTDKFAFNLQENMGDEWLLDVGSPVVLYNQFGQNFFNELPRTFAYRIQY